MQAVQAAIGALGSFLQGPQAAGSIGAPDPTSPGGVYPTAFEGPPNAGFAGTPPPPGSTFGAKDALSLLGLVGKTIEGIRNYQMQQNLQDPNYIRKQIAQLEGPEIAQLTSVEGPAIANQFGAAGLSGAPGLIAQGISSAITPQVLGDASSEYFSGLNASQGFGGGGTPGGEFNISQLINDLYPTS